MFKSKVRLPLQFKAKEFENSYFWSNSEMSHVKCLKGAKKVSRIMKPNSTTMDFLV